MTRRKSVVLGVSLCALALLAEAQISQPVRTQTGLVQGSVEGGLTVYKGVPFAAPPVGDLRWRAPEPPRAWTGVRKTDNFAPACIQMPVVNRALGMEPVQTSEDCLYLNIWTPAKSANERLPVMVWIYGGGFSIGGTSLSMYDGARLAMKGVVLVSVAYRVGELGFMAHPELTAEQHGHSGNYGLLDMIAGLKWVKQNIAGFGGDPGRVTIFGESAGGIAVSMLAASPLAKGLFHEAISESGGNFAPAQRDNEAGENMHSLARAEKDGAAFLAKLGAASIADARKKSAEEILKSQPPGLITAWPAFDAYVLNGDQYKLYEAGRYNDTPVLIGSNSDEGALFVPAINAEVARNTVRSGYGEYADKILAAYPAGSDAEALRSARDLFRDTAFAWPTWSWARLQAKTGKGKVYVYYFSHRPPYPNSPAFQGWGAAHTGEIPYVFENFPEAMQPTAADHELSEEMATYWTNFAKTGDPNGAGLPHWPAFTNASPEVMNLNDSSKAIPVPNFKQLEVLDGYYAWRRDQSRDR